MASNHAKNNAHDCARILATTQRLYGRVDDLTALLDLLAQTMVEHARGDRPGTPTLRTSLSAAGLLSRNGNPGVFRPLRLKGRPDPEELRSFVEHVGPGDSSSPTGLMGWCVARRMVALRQGVGVVRVRARRRHGPVEPAAAGLRGRVGEMCKASIAAYPSLKSQLAVPVLDPEMRGQARPRDTLGVLTIESDELLHRPLLRV